jgi:hypothetical protein
VVVWPEEEKRKKSELAKNKEAGLLGGVHFSILSEKAPAEADAFHK